MSIATTDLLLLAATSRPEDDVSTTGGAVDTTVRPEFTQLTSAAVAAFVSDGADTRLIDIAGRSAAGAYVTETVTLNGAAEVLSVNTYERLLKVVAQTTSATRTVTVKQGSGGATRGTIPVNEKGFVALYIKSASAASQTIRYEKEFWKNNHATLTLNNAQISLTADPSAKIRIGLAASKGDTATIANRLAAPGGISFVDDNVVQNVPGTTLEAVTVIGVWTEQTLAANDTPYNSTFTTQLTGASV